MTAPSSDKGTLRVLQVLHGLARAGAEQLVYELALANRERMTTEVVCLDHEGPLADELRRQGVAVHFTRRREGLDLRQVRRIARLAAAFRPHVVHCHQYTPLFYGALAAALAGTGKVLFTEHGRHYPDRVGRRRRAFNRFLARKVAHVTAVCRFTRGRLVELEGLPKRRIEVVYNGVDVRRLAGACSRDDARRRLGLQRDAEVVIQVGTFRAVKDQATAVRAFEHVRRERARAVLLFVGDGPDRGACEALADSLGLGGAVRFLGQRGDVPQVLPAADIMLMTSLSEAHSVSLLEGMAARLPVVATDVGGIPETVVDGQTGLLAPARHARALADALLRLLADPQLRRRMGRAGYRRVCARFRRHQMHRRYLEIYRGLAGLERAALRRPARAPAATPPTIDRRGGLAIEPRGKAGRPLRVLHVRTVRGTGGGPDKTILNSCRHLVALGHQADAFYILDRRRDTGRLRAHARELGIRLIAAREEGPISWATLRALSAALGRGRYDIVHTHEYKSNALAQLLRPLHGFAVVATAHGYNPTSRREHVYYALERLLFRHAAAVIAPNRSMYATLRGFGLPRARLHVIHNGIETAGRTPPDRVQGERVRLLYLGRLSPEKDPVNGVEALARLVRRGLDAELTLAGDGPQAARLRALAERDDLAGRVRLPGFVADVMPLLANADILISPSRTECMPNAVLEAMWAGVPVAATEVGGVGEMIRDGVEGLLCPPCEPEALADAAERLAGDPVFARRLADAAHRRLMEEFTFEKRMERIVRLYRHVLGR